jgi:hypothetical protein
VKQVIPDGAASQDRALIDFEFSAKEFSTNGSPIGVARWKEDKANKTCVG